MNRLDNRMQPHNIPELRDDWPGDAWGRSRAMTAMGRLAGGVAHELNNVLMIIRGNLEMFDECEDEQERLDRVAAVFDAASDISKLTEKLSAFSIDKWLNTAESNLDDAAARAAQRAKDEIGTELRVVHAPAAGLCTALADGAVAEDAIIELLRYVHGALPEAGIAIGAENVSLRGPDPKSAPRDYVAVTVSAEHDDRAPIRDVYAIDLRRLLIALGPAFGFARQSDGFVDADPEGAWAAIYLPRA